MACFGRAALVLLAALLCGASALGQNRFRTQAQTTVRQKLQQMAPQEKQDLAAVVPLIQQGLKGTFKGKLTEMAGAGGPQRIKTCLQGLADIGYNPMEIQKWLTQDSAAIPTSSFAQEVQNPPVSSKTAPGLAAVKTTEVKQQKQPEATKSAVKQPEATLLEPTVQLAVAKASTADEKKEQVQKGEVTSSTHISELHKETNSRPVISSSSPSSSSSSSPSSSSVSNLRVGALAVAAAQQQQAAAAGGKDKVVQEQKRAVNEVFPQERQEHREAQRLGALAGEAAEQQLAASGKDKAIQVQKREVDEVFPQGHPETQKQGFKISPKAVEVLAGEAAKQHVAAAGKDKAAEVQKRNAMEVLPEEPRQGSVAAKEQPPAAGYASETPAQRKQTAEEKVALRKELAKRLSKGVEALERVSAAEAKEASLESALEAEKAKVTHLEEALVEEKSERVKAEKESEEMHHLEEKLDARVKALEAKQDDAEGTKKLAALAAKVEDKEKQIDARIGALEAPKTKGEEASKIAALEDKEKQIDARIGALEAPKTKGEEASKIAALEEKTKEFKLALAGAARRLINVEAAVSSKTAEKPQSQAGMKVIRHTKRPMQPAE
eukprot:TRINITY_DN6345_c0_g1_i1.p1 TRINITY_DN6345_c0_g1~~TRINITY_DN6345_c0_g1_i1.p1  ORF type:complete len:629 (+),score=226.17 TRINITY_DN6345_c0_g1_i1:67-1887(+)